MMPRAFHERLHPKAWNMRHRTPEHKCRPLRLPPRLDTRWEGAVDLIKLRAPKTGLLLACERRSPLAPAKMGFCPAGIGVPSVPIANRKSVVWWKLLAPRRFQLFKPHLFGLNKSFISLLLWKLYTVLTGSWGETTACAHSR